MYQNENLKKLVNLFELKYSDLFVVEKHCPGTLGAKPLFMPII